MLDFFRLWLLVVASAMAVAGVLAVLIVGTPLFSKIGALFDRAFWPGRPTRRRARSSRGPTA